MFFPAKHLGATNHRFIAHVHRKRTTSCTIGQGQPCGLLSSFCLAGKHWCSLGYFVIMLIMNGITTAHAWFA